MSVYNITLYPANTFIIVLFVINSHPLHSSRLLIPALTLLSNIIKSVLGEAGRRERKWGVYEALQSTQLKSESGLQWTFLGASIQTLFS